MYLKKIGELRPLDIGYAVGALVLLLVPLVGSVYPVPAPPVNLFPYIFLAYFLVGLVVFVARRKSATTTHHLVPERMTEETALAS
jgi:hypothetical protein